MLCLRRRIGQWVRLTHRGSGQVIHLRVYRQTGRELHIAFGDDARNFLIERITGERIDTAGAVGCPPATPESPVVSAEPDR